MHLPRLLPVLGVGEVGVVFDHVVPCGPGGRQYRFQVLIYLVRLGLDVSLAHDLAVRPPSHNPRGVQDVARLDPVGELQGLGGIDAWGGDLLFSHG